VYDKDNLELKLEARFPSMDGFRLVVQTYAIKAEFEMFVLRLIQRGMMYIVEATKMILGMYMHEPNDLVEILSLYVFLSSIISLSILCLCLTIF
jgi:hypothetical protein